MLKRRRPVDTIRRQRSRKYNRKSVRRPDAVQWALLGIAVISAGLLLGRLGAYRASRSEYAAYQEMAAAQPTAGGAMPFIMPSLAPEAKATIPPIVAAAQAEPMPEDALVRELMRQNPDTVGWLNIRGTGIEYPIVQGGDNEHYAKYTFAGKKGGGGAIFVDCMSAGDFSGFNTVIYGHNMKDGSMFATLDQYEKQAFLDKHLSIEVKTLHETLQYEVFAAYVSKGLEDFDFRGHTVSTEEDRRSFILAARKRAANYSRATVATTDRLLTLVTCTDGTQPWYFVVHAVLVG